MFSKSLRIHNTLNKTFQSAFFKARRGFTSSIDKPRILEMLEEIHQNPKSYQRKSNFQDLIILDKLNETPHSTTFRAFNRQTHSFVAHQTILVHHPLSFAHIELILDQYNLSPQRPHFSDILSIQYDKQRKEAQVLTELDKATLQDIASYLATNQNQLSDEVLSEYAWQLLDLIVKPTTTIDSIQLQNVSVDLKENSLRVHDFIDFATSKLDPLSQANLKRDSMKIISSTIKKIANIANQEAFQTRFPKTVESIEEMKDIAQAWDKGHIEKALINLKSRMQGRQSISSMVSENYNTFIVEKILNALKTQNPSQFVENGDLIKKLLIKSNRQIYMEHLENLKKTEEDQLSQAKYYKTLDQYELSSKFYSQAFQARLKIGKVEKLLEKCESVTYTEPPYKSPIVQYIDSLPKFLTQFFFPALIMGLILWITDGSLERNKAAWEDYDSQKPASPPEQEIIPKKLEEETKAKEKRKDRIQLLKFGISATTVVGLGFLLERQYI